MDDTRAAWGLWSRWVAATGISLIVGYTVGTEGGEAVSAALDEPVRDDQVAGRPMGLLVVLAAVGAAIGAAQWLVLRRHLAGAGWWVPASVVGYAALALLAALGVPDLPSLGPPGIGRESGAADALGFITDGALLGATLGTLVGVAQWPVLRHLPRAGWWVAASAAGWAVQQAADAAVLVLGDMGLMARPDTGVLLGEILLAALYLGGVGAVTGAALMWLLRSTPGSRTRS